MPNAVPKTTTTAKSLMVYWRPFHRSCRFSHTTSMRAILRQHDCRSARLHRPANPAFQEPQRHCQQPGGEQIKQARGDPAFDRAEELGIDSIRCEAQFADADKEGDPGVF